MADKSYLGHIAPEYAAELNGRGIVVTEFTPPAAAEYANGLGTVGSRFLDDSRLTKTKYDGAFPFGLEPTYDDAAALLAATMFSASGGTSSNFAAWTGMILPTTAAGGTCEFAIDYKDAGRTFSSCYTDTVSLEWSESDPVKLTFGLVTTAAYGTATVTAGTADAASMVCGADGTCFIGTDRYFPLGGKLECNRKLIKHYSGSPYPIITTADVFEVTGSLTLSLNSDMWTILAARIDAKTTGEIAMQFYDGTNGIGYAVPKARITSPLPSFSGEGETTYELTFMGYGNSENIVSFWTK
jgi:hypothetical protein